MFLFVKVVLEDSFKKLKDFQMDSPYTILGYIIKKNYLGRGAFSVLSCTGTSELWGKGKSLPFQILAEIYLSKTFVIKQSTIYYCNHFRIFRPSYGSAPRKVEHHGFRKYCKGSWLQEAKLFLIKSYDDYFLKSESKIWTVLKFEPVGQCRVHEFIVIFISILSNVYFRLVRKG